MASRPVFPGSRTSTPAVSICGCGLRRHAGAFSSFDKQTGAKQSFDCDSGAEAWVVRRVIAAQKRDARMNSAQDPLCQDLPGSRMWQTRFYDYNVWTRHKRVEKTRYIHRNPVRRGLVESPEQWSWSSFRAYAYGEAGLVRVNDWSVLKLKIRQETS